MDVQGSIVNESNPQNHQKQTNNCSSDQFTNLEVQKTI